MRPPFCTPSSSYWEPCLQYSDFAKGLENEGHVFTHTSATIRRTERIRVGIALITMTTVLAR